MIRENEAALMDDDAAQAPEMLEAAARKKSKCRPAWKPGGNHGGVRLAWGPTEKSVLNGINQTHE